MTLSPERLEEIRAITVEEQGGSPGGVRDRLTSALRDLLASHDAQSARIAALEAENFALAAQACLCVKGDDGGNAYCEKQQRIAALETALRKSESAVRSYADELARDGFSDDATEMFALADAARTLLGGKS